MSDEANKETATDKEAQNKARREKIEKIALKIKEMAVKTGQTLWPIAKKCAASVSNVIKQQLEKRKQKAKTEEQKPDQKEPDQKGFSLIELMITVVIIGVLVAIAIPSYTTYVNRAKLVDLFNAIHLGENMVQEYLQSTGASDCTNISPNTIPVTSPNIAIASISGDISILGTPSCSIVVVGNPAAFGVDISFLTHFEGSINIPSVDLISYSIPEVILTAPLGGGDGGGENVILAATPILASIPTIGADRSITWTLYSNGSSAVSGSIPALPGLGLKDRGDGGNPR